MKKKKSRKLLLEQSEVNVVPLMDILTTMLFFLILMASAANYATLFANGEEGSGAQTNEVKFDLAIALHTSKKATIHLTDPSYLKPMNDGIMNKANRSKYRSSGNKVISREVQAKGPKELLYAIQSELTAIKKAFPLEDKLTLAVADNINYQEMLNTMDAITQLPDGKEFSLTDPIGRTRKNRVLFPQIALRGLSNGNKE